MDEKSRRQLIERALAGEPDRAKELSGRGRFAAARARMRDAGQPVEQGSEEEWELMRLFNVPEWAEPVQPSAPVGYEELARVLMAALDQAARGKGKERHANDRPFAKQPILKITEDVGVGFPLGQVMKKAQEAAGMATRGEREAAQAELLGVIVYAAAAHIALA